MRQPDHPHPKPLQQGPFITVKAAVLMVLFLALMAYFFGKPLAFALLGKRTVPMPAVELIDMANALEPQEQQEILEKIRALRAATGAELAILLVAKPQQGSLEGLALMMGNRWQLGRPNIGDGLLLSIAVQTQEIRLDIGCGLEAEFSNADAQSIVENVIVPQWRAQGMAAALVAGTTAIIDKVSQANLPPLDAPLPKTPLWYGKATSAGCQAPRTP
jgi:uncharacterized membrane protein YgcG